MSSHMVSRKALLVRFVVALAFVGTGVLAGWVEARAQGGGGPGSGGAARGVSEPVDPTPGAQEANQGKRVPLAPSAAPFPTHWYTVVGDVFTPSHSGATYNDGGSGCLQSTSNTNFRASVNLPDGAIAKYIYVDYYNYVTDTYSTRVNLMRYNETGGGSANLAFVDATDSTPGFHYKVSAEFTATVDNLGSAYAFLWTSAPGDQYLCAVQVGYYLMDRGVYAPYVLR